MWLLTALALAAPATIGAAAPGFTLPNTDGTAVSLAQFQGKTVVLEWFNPDCPFVVAAHSGEGVLRALPGRTSSDQVAWLAINSGAASKQGADKKRNVAARKEYAMDYPVLLDADGAVGKAYGATNTPHIFIVDPKGTLVYAGAVDNAPMGKLETPPMVNYVEAALADIAAGRPVAQPTTKAVGCSVKY